MKAVGSEVRRPHRPRAIAAATTTASSPTRATCTSASPPRSSRAEVGGVGMQYYGNQRLGEARYDAPCASRPRAYGKSPASRSRVRRRGRSRDRGLPRRARRRRRQQAEGLHRVDHATRSTRRSRASTRRSRACSGARRPPPGRKSPGRSFKSKTVLDPVDRLEAVRLSGRGGGLGQRAGPRFRARWCRRCPCRGRPDRSAPPNSEERHRVRRVALAADSSNVVHQWSKAQRLQVGPGLLVSSALPRSQASHARRSSFCSSRTGHTCRARPSSRSPCSTRGSARR